MATLAHELRNPLAPIRLSAELLGIIEPEDPEFEEARGIILRQVNHMVRLVDDLLDVSRVAQGKITLRREPVDLASIVAAAVETSAPAIEAGGHALEISLPTEPILVDGDAMRLAQVVANILNNAAKYTTHVGRIGLDVRREGDEAVLRVRDDGIGIPAEMLPRIFDMFTQVEGHLSRAQGGLGIGLTLCQRLIEMHGGTIEARSEGIGQGSEFVIRLASVNAVAVPAAPVPIEAGRAWRVLVVDDNVDGAWTLAGLLRAMGHEVHVAHGGQEALRMAEALEPEVVLLDIGLPDLSGYEVARRLRAHPRLAGILLVAQTGWGREEDVAQAREAGFDRHLVKPLARTDLDRLFAQLSA